MGCKNSHTKLFSDLMLQGKDLDITFDAAPILYITTHNPPTPSDSTNASPHFRSYRLSVFEFTVVLNVQLRPTSVVLVPLSPSPSPPPLPRAEPAVLEKSQQKNQKLALATHGGFWWLRRA